MIEINHEYYVSLEVAKLLKKAGFDWETLGYYNKLGFFHRAIPYHGEIPAPTLEVAQRWLREVKNIDVVVSRAMQWKQFYYTIEHEENRTSKIDFMSLNEDLWWLKYEEALEAGIKKALEIILENGE
jgi:hypothetical protein